MRRGRPLFIGEVRQCVHLYLARSLVSTASTWCHVTAIRRRGREAPGRERPGPGSSRSMTSSDGHRLHTVGSGLDIERVPGCLAQFELI
jgi:hypothetical protein